MECVFCKIIKGEIPSYKIYEDEYTLAFLDIALDVDGHTLVIPKNHCCNVVDSKNEDYLHVMSSVKKIVEHYVNDCKYDGCNILNASGIAAQQSVMHLHFHIIPRKNDDKLDAFMNFNGAKHGLDEMHQFLKLK
ncbi:MAG: HIT domain-containing protein [Erysipelotrichaceae bacterium]|nr:HIT domain-containing protein [Erysipelotrichaceae bacterium]